MIGEALPYLALLAWLWSRLPHDPLIRPRHGWLA